MTALTPVLEPPGLSSDAAQRQWLAEAWAQKPTVFSVDVEGAAIACRGWNLDRTDLPGLVLLHGFRAHAQWWDHIAPSFLRSHRVVAPSLSGMGDSDRRESYSRFQFARELIAVADAVKFDRPALACHSFGSVIGLMACKAAPDRFGHIIIIDSALPPESVERTPMPIVEHRLYRDKASAVSRFRLLPPGQWPQPEVFAYIAEHSVWETPEGWTWKFDHLLSRTLNDDDYHQAFRPITVPLDVIYGDRSEVLTPERIEAALRVSSKTGRLILIPAAHHHILIEQPMPLVAALLALLANDR